jgi:hypothetical protein
MHTRLRHEMRERIDARRELAADGDACAGAPPSA